MFGSLSSIGRGAEHIVGMFRVAGGYGGTDGVLCEEKDVSLSCARENGVAAHAHTFSIQRWHPAPHLRAAKAD
jgi:hypothetical protein